MTPPKMTTFISSFFLTFIYFALSIFNAPGDAEAASYADVNNAAAMFLKREYHRRRRVYETASFAFRHFSWGK